MVSLFFLFFFIVTLLIWLLWHGIFERKKYTCWPRIPYSGNISFRKGEKRLSDKEKRIEFVARRPVLKEMLGASGQNRVWKWTHAYCTIDFSKGAMVV